jgi:MoxR-like ATPase
MRTWELSPDPSDSRTDRWRSLPVPAIAGLSGPEYYVCDRPLADAINTAITLGQPLLITGDPGCGKTELANFVAWKLGLEMPRHTANGSTTEYAIRFDTKSTTAARDFFYTFDTVARFGAAYAASDVDPKKFITLQALGRAILYATEPSSLSQLLPQNLTHSSKRRSVVLIDEIDKAPRDVPNDLLMEIEGMRFFIPEISLSVEADRSYRPILVITSNSEKALPDAFLRRCVYYNMAFPDEQRLAEIVNARISGLPRDSTFVSDAISVFTALRKLALRKRPGTAELLGFVLALKDKGYLPDHTLRGRNDWLEEAKVTLLKTSEDQRDALANLRWP